MKAIPGGYDYTQPLTESIPLTAEMCEGADPRVGLRKPLLGLTEVGGDGLVLTHVLVPLTPKLVQLLLQVTNPLQSCNVLAMRLLSHSLLAVRRGVGPFHGSFATLGTAVGVVEVLL